MQLFNSPLISLDKDLVRVAQRIGTKVIEVEQ
jgi:adenylyl- and sulfurtransferase ThiI